MVFRSERNWSLNKEPLPLLGLRVGSLRDSFTACPFLFMPRDPGLLKRDI